MVVKCWLATILEVTRYSQSLVLGFCLHAIFHRTLCKNHDMMISHGTKQIGVNMVYLKSTSVLVIL